MNPAYGFGFILSAMLVLVAPAAADTLVFKSGSKSNEGEVRDVSADGRTVTFYTPHQGERVEDRAAIERIEWSSMESLLRVAKSNPDPAFANELQGLMLNALSRAQSAHQKGDLQTARKEYTSLWMALADGTAQSLLGDANNRKLGEAVKTALPEVSFQLGKKLMTSPNTRAQAKEILQEAVTSRELADGRMSAQSVEYRFELARLSEALDDRQTAAVQYSAIAASPAASAAMVNASKIALANLGVPAVAATPPVAQVPQPAVAQPPPPQAGPGAAQPSVAAPPPQTATPAPVQQGSPPAGPQWKRILWQVNNSEIVAEMKAIPGQIADGEHTGAITALSVVVLIGWVLPYSFLAFRARRGDLFAEEYRQSAKKVGLFALVPWARKVAGQKPPKNRCPFCNKGIDNIDSYTDLNFYACPHCRENITPIYDMKDYVDHLVQQLEMASKRKTGSTDMGAVVEKDAMLKLVRGVLTLAVRRRASDLHAESDPEGLKIRARIDGIMYDMMALPQSIANSYVSAIKVMANLDITERRMPQDGKLSLWIDKTDVDLRINTSPAGIGERVSIRILNQKIMLSDPTKLGLDGDNLEKYQTTIYRPHGLIIVTGPSGSGKSTTLFVALNELNTGVKNIVTIEDPVEYQIKGVSQMQVNTAANFTFATGLRSILRQDPDIIMVGEIRDKETAEIAMDAATTGHLVFTTLHTIDGPTAFSRMADLGVEMRRISSAVSCVIGQRLIRTICMDCKKPFKPKKQDLDVLHLSNTGRDITYVHGSGCENCMNTGYHGRTGIFEFLMPDDAMREILEANASVSVIRELAKKNGYRNLREEGVLKIMNGLTTPEEVVRMTS